MEAVLGLVVDDRLLAVRDFRRHLLTADEGHAVHVDGARVREPHVLDTDAPVAANRGSLLLVLRACHGKALPVLDIDRVDALTSLAQVVAELDPRTGSARRAAREIDVLAVQLVTLGMRETH